MEKRFRNANYKNKLKRMLSKCIFFNNHSLEISIKVKEELRELGSFLISRLNLILDPTWGIFSESLGSEDCFRIVLAKIRH